MTLFWIVLSLSVLPVSYSPASPTVGDPVSVIVPLSSGERILVRPSPGYEIVSSVGNRVVVRSFKPGSFTLEGVVIGQQGRRTFRGPEIRISSVLAENDALKPAPLKPPVELPPNPTQWIALGSASLLCVLAWGGVLARSRGVIDFGNTVSSSAADEYKSLLAELRRSPRTDATLVLLADGTRQFLSRSDPSCGRELTTFEILTAMRRRGARHETVSAATNLLRAGDLAKFSPWGAGSVEYDQFLTEAETILAFAPSKEAA